MGYHGGRIDSKLNRKPSRQEQKCWHADVAYKQAMIDCKNGGMNHRDSVKKSHIAFNRAGVQFEYDQLVKSGEGSAEKLVDLENAIKELDDKFESFGEIES